MRAAIYLALKKSFNVRLEDKVGKIALLLPGEILYGSKLEAKVVHGRIIL
jgi:hypothetical protein